MIQIKTIGTWGFEGAIHGMRMPYESFDKSDSFNAGCRKYNDNECGFPCSQCLDWEADFQIGDNDMLLCKKLIKGGSEHRKFLRMIHVQAEVKAPRYWWAEMDKYKYVEANSSSTMHLITKKYLTTDDFTLNSGIDDNADFICDLNLLIEYYRKAESKEEKDAIFRSIKQHLPESYNQLRMIDTNYECLLNIYRQRKNHRLTEWHRFCDWIEGLPYMKEFLS